MARAVGTGLVAERRERLGVGDDRGCPEAMPMSASPATAHSSVATSRSPITTRAPRASRAFAVAQPTPLAAPVMAIVLPLILSM
jgi:hypothetical protein